VQIGIDEKKTFERKSTAGVILHGNEGLGGDSTRGEGYERHRYESASLTRAKYLAEVFPLRGKLNIKEGAGRSLEGTRMEVCPEDQEKKAGSWFV